MAGVVVTFEHETTTGTGTDILMEIIPADNHYARLLELSLMLGGVVVTDAPIRFRFVKLSTVQTGGTGITGTVTTPHDASVLGTPYVVQTTAKQNDGSAEVISDVIKNWRIHPQGSLIYPVPQHDQIILSPTGSTANSYAIQVFGTATSVAVSITVVVEE